jgi:hypothetical protein
MRSFRIYAALLLVLALMASIASAQDEVRCTACGKTIAEGNYWKTGGKVFCETCHNTLPRCGRCQAPLTMAFPLEGKNICEDCLKGLPRCASCGRPMIRYYSKDREILCAACFDRKSPHCSMCGAVMTGKYQKNGNRFTGIQKEYCLDCIRNYPECYACGELAGRGGRTLQNGRSICEECLRTAVFDLPGARVLYEEVASFMGARMGMRLNELPSLSLVTTEELAALQNYQSRNVGTDQMGLYTSKHITVIRNEVRSDMTRDPRVHILQGLPREAMAPVMAHELAHGWSAEKLNKPRDPETEEGFAEWMAYKYLQAAGGMQQMKHMESRTDLYGRGLQRMLELEARGGSKAVLEYMFGR